MIYRALAIQPAVGRTRLLHVDGLRALAIIPVLLYHSNRQLLPGGFIGVDIFFVISGYLITQGITTQLRAGEFSIADFYARRIKRIVPAYAAVVLGVLCISPIAFSVSEWKAISVTAGYSILYSANIYFYGAVSYFDLPAQSNPLLHLWSLGVEAQFYLALPVVLWATWLVLGRRIVIGLGVILAISLAISVAAVDGDHARFAFYMLPSRAWELLAGGLASEVRKLDWARASPWPGMAGLAAIFLSYALIDERMSFPGITVAPAVIGTALLLVAGGTGGVSGLLSHPSMRFIGKISYSLYLWHWPVFVVLGATASFPRAIGGWLVSFALAIISWRFIETPVRQRR